MISCHIHDYIEIACMYHMPIELCLINNTTVLGIAQDTVFNDKREECIKISADDGDLLIVLNELVSMRAINDNPHFTTINFS